MFKNTKKILLSLLFLQLIFIATPALAATEICFTPQIDIPGMTFKECSDKTKGKYAIDGNSIGNFILTAYKYTMGIVGILSAIILMVAGVLWLTAGGNSQRVSEAQAYIKGSLSGLLLMLFSFTILATINPDLVSFKSITPEIITRLDEWRCCSEKKGEFVGFAVADTTGKKSLVCKNPDPTDVSYGGIIRFNNKTQTCVKTGESWKPEFFGCCLYGEGSAKGIRDNCKEIDEITCKNEKNFYFEKGQTCEKLSIGPNYICKSD